MVGGYVGDELGICKTFPNNRVDTISVHLGESLGGPVVADKQVEGQGFDGRLLVDDKVVEHGATDVAGGPEKKNPVNGEHCLDAY